MDRNRDRNDHRIDAGATPSDDLRLASRAAEGDRAAFEEIYQLHVNRIYGLSLRLTADRGEAEILTQDTFVKAWFAMPGYSGRGSLGGWLGRVASNLWKDRFRARARRLRLAEELAAEGSAGTEVTPPDAVGEARYGQVAHMLTALDLERCIARLPEGARIVYVFHEVEGYTHREIADMLDVAVGTVKGQLHRARRLIRAMFENDRMKSHGT